LTERENKFPTKEEIAKEFGEFNPPDSSSFPSELQGPVPRKIGEHIKQGQLERKRRQTAYAVLSVAVTLIGLSFFGFVRQLGYYILPLAYLDLIGYGLIILLLISYLLQKIKLGRYKYVRHGIPIFCRVIHTHLRVTEAHHVRSIKFASIVEFNHPETNERMYLGTVSPEIGTANQADVYSTTVKNGDYVNCVYLPGKLETSLQIYGYLGLNPDIDFVLKNGHKIEEHISSWKLASYIGIILIILVLLVGFLYAFEFCFPVEPNWWFFGISLAGALLTGLIATIVAAYKVKDAKKSVVKFCLSGFIVGAVLGLFMMLAALPVLNSLFDHSKGQFKKIEITEFWQETYNYIIRNYKIEYHLVGQTKTEKYPSTFQNMAYFQQTYFGIIEVKNGAFNWPWISHIWPVVFVRSNERGQLEFVSAEQMNQSDAHKIDLAIMRGPEDFMPVDEEFRKYIIEELAKPENNQ
jgi:hypothetical protein